MRGLIENKFISKELQKVRDLGTHAISADAVVVLVEEVTCYFCGSPKPTEFTLFAIVDFSTEMLLIMTRSAQCFTLSRGKQAESDFGQQRRNK